MTGRPVKVKRAARVIAEVIMLTASIWLCNAPNATAQSPLPMSYSARLTNSNGSPIDGPLPVKATFWDSATGGQQLGPTLSFDSAQLTNGVLNLELGLSSSQVNDVFSDGSRAVYIELTAADKTYPRQMYSFVPLALRVPFDDKNLKVNDSGKLTLSVGVKPSANSFLTQDANGVLSWGTPSGSISAIVDADIAAGAAISQSKISGLSATLATKEGAIATGTASQYFRGDKTWQSLTTTAVSESGTNLYYTDARARSALVPSAPITYSIVSGTIGIGQAGSSQHGYLSSTDWATFNGKQEALGFSPLNKAGDTMSGVLDMSGSDLKTSGDIGMAASKTLLLSNNATDPTGLTSTDKGKTWFNSATNEIKYWDGTAVKSLGIAGSGLANLNGVTSTTQTFATPGNGGTSPGWISTGSAHTLNIPLASASGVTAGLLSNSEYVSLNSKLNTVAGSTAVSVATSSGTATITLANTSVTAGNYTRANITVDAQGRLTSAQSAPAIVDSDISSTAAVSQSKIAGLSTSLNGKENTIAPGTATQYFRGDKTWQDLNTAAVPESGANQYYSDARSRASLTPTAPITYSVVTGTVGINQASGSANGYLSAVDWATFNGKQEALGYSPLKKTGDTMSGALDMSGSDLKNTGNIGMTASKTLLLSNNATDPTGLTATDKGKTWFNSASNEIKYWDGTATKSLGIAGSGLQSFNGLSSNSQTLTVPGTAGTAPAWSSTGTAHTLNIPLASAASVTAGLLSNADYATFNNKISSVTAGTGLTGGGGSGAVTLNADVGTTANKLVQLDANAKLPAVDGSALTSLSPANLAAAVPVSKGGTGLTSGTAGGIPYFSATSAITSTASLTVNGVLLGGGSSGPSATAAGAANSVLRVPSAGGAPSFGAIDLAQSAAVGGLLGVANGGTGVASTSANYVFAGPIGATGAPSFRGLVAADYPSMVGADGTSAGTRGAVPAPAATDNAKFLRGDGTWQTPPAAAAGSGNQIQFNSGGVLSGNANFVYAGGNVGIGTTVPGSKLQVLDGDLSTYSSSGNNGLSLQGATNSRYWITQPSATNILAIGGNGATAPSSGALNISPNGNVGIGTTAPNTNLDIIVGGTGTGASFGDQQTTIRDNNASSQELRLGVNTLGLYSYIQATQKLVAHDRLLLNPNGGNVGIGTTSPSATLEVQSNVNLANATDAQIRAVAGPTSPYGAGIKIDSTAITGGRNWTIFSSGGSAGEGQGKFVIQDKTGSANRLIIDTNGNLGIGQTGPTAALDVAGGIRAEAFTTLASGQGAHLMWNRSGGQGETNFVNNPGGGPGGFNFNLANSAGTVTSTPVTINSSGNVGIGTTNPGAKLEVAGTAGTDGIKFPDGTLQTSAGIMTNWVNAGAGTIGAQTTAPTKGTTSTDRVSWRRVGDTMELRFRYVQSVTGTAGSGYYLLTIPGGYAIDTSKLPVPSNAIDYRAPVGTISFSYGSGGVCTGPVYAYNSTQLFAEMHCYNSGTGVGMWGSGYIHFALTANMAIYIQASFPISGW